MKTRKGKENIVCLMLSSLFIRC